MNPYIRRVFTAYLAALVLLSFFIPWYGAPVEPWADLPVFLHAPLWHPPRTVGYVFAIDFGRLFLVVLSLSAVMAAAVVSLWGKTKS